MKEYLRDQARGVTDGVAGRHVVREILQAKILASLQRAGAMIPLPSTAAPLCGSCTRQRASGLRFGDPRVLALLSVLVLFRLLPRGFTNRDLRDQVATVLGREHSVGQMTYDLRRLRLHGFIERLPKTRRYRVTHLGFRPALFLTRAYARLLRPGLAALPPASEPPTAIPFRRALDRVDTTIQQAWEAQQTAA